MNLLATKAQVKLAKLGIDLLSRKKDAMLYEFLDMLGTVYELRTSLREKLHEDVRDLVIAEALLGTRPIISASGASRQNVDVILTERNLWGARICNLQHSFKVRDIFGRKYNPRGVETAVDVIAERFERVVQSILVLIPAETNMRSVGHEIKTTNRKINALQQQLLPKLLQRAAYITQALEERAREDTFRLKKLKKRKRKT